MKNPILARVKQRSSKNRIPLALSMLSAGDAVEMSEDYDLLDLNEMVTGGRDGFVAYIVTGDSMLDEIRPGSIIFVDRYCEPKPGDVIASCVNGRNNVKIFERRANRLYLVSANKKYEPKEVIETDTFHILGVVKGFYSQIRPGAA